MEFSKAFGASFRETVKSERDGKSTRIVRASRTYPTNQSDLWSALTEKVRIKRWFAEVSGAVSYTHLTLPTKRIV